MTHETAKELSKKIIEAVAQANDLDTVIKWVETELKGYWQNREDSERLIQIERYLEHTFVVSHFMHMEQQAAIIAQMLKKQPGDIGAMAQLERMENDMRIIEPRMKKLSAELLTEIQNAHGNGTVFKYFQTKFEPSSTLIINK